MTFLGRSRIPSAVISTSTRSPSARRAAFRMSAGMVTVPFLRTTVTDMSDLLSFRSLTFRRSAWPIRHAQSTDRLPDGRHEVLDAHVIVPVAHELPRALAHRTPGLRIGGERSQSFCR